LQTVTLDEAQARLADLIEAAAGGEEIFIATSDQFSVQLVPRIAPTRRRQPGSARGLLAMASDFDAPLDDFAPYSQ
jgi:antitoxin (DNA-binding transcriptional repressor) of toxin-antitoxin stability system